jgi:hypothetical protein
MTKGELFKLLEQFPDDIQIMCNIERDGQNWDTWDLKVMADAFMCTGYEGCKHTEPEMSYEIVFFIDMPV